MVTGFFQAPDQKEEERGVRRLCTWYPWDSVAQDPARGEVQVTSPCLRHPDLICPIACSPIFSHLLSCPFITCQMSYL